MRKKTTCLALVLSVLLGIVGATVIGCGSRARKPPADAEKSKDPGTAMEGVGMGPGSKTVPPAKK